MLNICVSHYKFRSNYIKRAKSVRFFIVRITRDKYPSRCVSIKFLDLDALSSHSNYWFDSHFFIFKFLDEFERLQYDTCVSPASLAVVRFDSPRDKSTKNAVKNFTIIIVIDILTITISNG